MIVNEITKGGVPIKGCLRATELYPLKLAQKGIAIKGAKMLASCVLMEEDILRRKCKFIYVGLRASIQIPQVFGTAVLPIFHSNHSLAKLCLERAHEVGHEGTISTLRRSRKEVWVIGGRQLVDLVHGQCTECRLKEKKCLEQRMGPLLDH